MLIRLRGNPPEGVRSTLFLYTDTDSEQAQQLERSRYNFLDISGKWKRKGMPSSQKLSVLHGIGFYENFKIFINGDTIPFSKIDLKLIEEFRLYLLSAKRGGFKTGTISPIRRPLTSRYSRRCSNRLFIDRLSDYRPFCQGEKVFKVAKAEENT